jgi:1-acyl-sn-glycerol-3-phosphate acyltransferase
VKSRELTRKLCAWSTIFIFRPRITGIENLPRDRPFILAANHLAFCDHIFLAFFSPQPVYFVGKAERLEGTGLRGLLRRLFFKRIGFIPVRRDGGRGGVAALEASVARIQQGQSVGIHPEGTRSPDGRLYRGHTGAAWLSLTTGAPVVPCGIVGTDRVQPPGRLMLWPSSFELNFGRQLDPQAYAGRERLSMSRRLFTDEIMREIQALSRQEAAPEFAVRGLAIGTAGTD